jgi:hypothetical protein
MLGGVQNACPVLLQLQHSYIPTMPPSHFQIRTVDGNIQYYDISELSKLIWTLQMCDMDNSYLIAKVSFYWNGPNAFRNLILRRNQMDWFVPDYEYSSGVGPADLDDVLDTISRVPELYELFGTRIQWE